jgi:hypothetical protein
MEVFGEMVDDNYRGPEDATQEEWNEIIKESHKREPWKYSLDKKCKGCGVRVLNVMKVSTCQRCRAIDFWHKR